MTGRNGLRADHGWGGQSCRWERPGGWKGQCEIRQALRLPTARADGGESCPLSISSVYPG